MKSLPHDYYLKFTDSSVLADVMEFHSKGNYTLHKAFKHMSYLHNINNEHLRTLTGKELKLYQDMNLSSHLQQHTLTTSDLIRNDSCEKFSDREVPFEIIECLMQPLLSKHNETYKRGYPSAGALYPIETFVCSLNDSPDHWPFKEKVIHLLPHSKKFETIQNTLNARVIKESMFSTTIDIGKPSLAIIYAAFLPKTLFKYRHRGYRLALMEAGSIYMLIELQAKFLNLRCRLWSAYTDTMLCKAMGLNPAIFSILCVHFIGHQE